MYNPHLTLPSSVSRSRHIRLLISRSLSHDVLVLGSAVLARSTGGIEREISDYRTSSTGCMLLSLLFFFSLLLIVSRARARSNSQGRGEARNCDTP